MTAFPFLTIASAVAIISIINNHTHLVVAAVAVVESQIDQDQTVVDKICVNEDDSDCTTTGGAAADDEKAKEKLSIFERIDEWMKGTTTTSNNDNDKAATDNNDDGRTGGIDFYLKKLFEGPKKTTKSQTHSPPSTTDSPTTTTTSSDSNDTKQQQEKEEKQKPNDPFSFLSQIFSNWSTKDKDSSSSSSSSTTRRNHLDALNLIQHARSFANTQQERRTFEQNFKLFSTSFALVLSSLKDHFGQLLHDLPNISPLSLFYFMEEDEERKNPTWKRRVHRFRESYPPEEVPSLHERMLLAELAYLDSVEEMREGLTRITGGQWELIYGTVESAPHEPSHFLALKTGHDDDDDEEDDEDELPLLLSVRGTKEIGDALSDALLDAIDYDKGKTHRGILLAGRYLVEKHTSLLTHLLASSGRSRIRLTLVGHSLGAGAATIAAMEFNALTDPPVRATVWGYGCPSLLSPALAREVEGYVTTIVGDADVVPRLSGASVVNWLLDVASYDWTERALKDVESFIQRTEGEVGQSVAEWILPKENVLRFINETLRGRLEKETRGVVERRRRRRAMEEESKPPPPVLIPPGRCVHFYRDGKSVSAKYMPCDFFNRIDMSLTMIEDHLTPTGYHRLFLEMMREHHQDYGYKFLHESVFIAT